MKQEHGQQRVHIPFAGCGHTTVAEASKSQTGESLRQPAHTGPHGQPLGLFLFHQTLQRYTGPGGLADVFGVGLDDFLGVFRPPLGLGANGLVLHPSHHLVEAILFHRHNIGT